LFKCLPIGQRAPYLERALKVRLDFMPFCGLDLHAPVKGGVFDALRASEKRFDRPISKRRFRIGQCFGTMKRLFGPTGTHARLAIGQNLLEAASRIARNTQPPASA